ncbi:MAG: hypothetical protein JSS20_11160 [Proteobacteria bacterium]|nr:hypothetical protein [Pseudomonadota bacterium]
MKVTRKLLVAASFLGVATASAIAACTIPSSPCFPWRIEAGQNEAVILEIVPNNAVTSALYRICLCPPSSGVSLMFDFDGRQVELGTLDIAKGETLCRDWRLQTARKSRLMLKRVGSDNSSKVEGCYTTQ